MSAVALLVSLAKVHIPHQRSGGVPFLALACLGVVYGDIGTSPLYALRE